MPGTIKFWSVWNQLVPLLEQFCFKDGTIGNNFLPCLEQFCNGTTIVPLKENSDWMETRDFYEQNLAKQF